MTRYIDIYYRKLFSCRIQGQKTVLTYNLKEIVSDEEYVYVDSFHVMDLSSMSLSLSLCLVSLSGPRSLSFSLLPCCLSGSVGLALPLSISFFSVFLPHRQCGTLSPPHIEANFVSRLLSVRNYGCWKDRGLPRHSRCLLHPSHYRLQIHLWKSFSGVPLQHRACGWRQVWRVEHERRLSGWMEVPRMRPLSLLLSSSLRLSLHLYIQRRVKTLISLTRLVLILASFLEQQELDFRPACTKDLDWEEVCYTPGAYPLSVEPTAHIFLFRSESWSFTT